MKKLYATILYSGIFFGILFPFDFAGAYSVGTHAFLTKEIIDSYNKNFPQSKISEELADYLVDGARMEDNTPRYINHFYDPVNNRGLADGGFRGQKSKDWAKDSVAQTAFLYRSFSPTEASILSLAQVEKIKSVFDQSDFTWKKAVDLYVDGREEEALFTLGHVIHLVEDMAVPDHVRNDAHPPYDNGGSPYENWTEKFNLGNSDNGLKSRLSGKKPVILGDLDSYFDELATYTNNNFYSADSIKKYSLPQSEYFVNSGIYKYGVKTDEFGYRYYLVAFKNKSISVIDKVIKESSILDDFKIDQLSGESLETGALLDYGQDLIISNYWDRLSVKSVQYGAGVIDLFFREVEKEKQNRVAKPNLPTRYFGQAIDLLREFIPGLGNNSGQNLNLASTINLVKDNPDAGFPASSARTSLSDATENSNPENDTSNDFSTESEESVFINVQDFNNDTQNEEENLITEEVIEEDSVEVPVITVVEKKIAQVCTFATDKSATHEKLLINEVAWMGGINSANDEWIELRNISGGVLDISGWQLLDKSEQIKLTFGNLKLEAGALVLLERTDDNSVLGVKADAIYAGALSNSDEGLRLFDSECNLMDEAIAVGEWPAGDASARRTMERATGLSWQTYAGGDSGHGGVSLFGTPKQDNSQPGVASVSSAIVSNNSEVSNNSTPATDEDSGPKKIIISEIQINGGTGKANYDFIELYNPNSTQVNLNGYRLVKRTKTGIADSSIKSWTTDAYIPANGYYLWANSDYAGISSTPDVTTSSTLSADNGVALRYGAADTGEIIDSVAWGASANAFIEGSVFPENPVANQSISRQSETDGNDNSVDFIKTLLSPKNSSNSGGFISPTAWSSQSASVISYPLISEVYPDQTGANADFIELYNPNASGTPALNLSGWSLQVLSANATSTVKITKKNFENGNSIPASGFFLVGIDDFIGGGMSWASGSLNSTDGATIFLVNGTTTISDFEDSGIIDKFAYGSGTGLISPENSAVTFPDSGKSWERKALSGNLCVSASGSGEYLGNGCDTDDNSADFEMRATSDFQKNSNLAEPRNAPSVVSGFSVSYSTTTLKVSLVWNLSEDAEGATSTIDYVLQYATSTNPLSDLAVASATSTYEFKLSEVGIDYEFSISARDRDGYSSSAVSADIAVPGLFNGGYFYPDPRNSGLNAIEIRYDSFPFIHPSNTNAQFRVAVFYKNREAPAIPYFYSDLQYATTPDGNIPKIYGEWGTEMADAWRLEFENCSGSTTNNETALIIVDSESFCNANYGGVRNGSLDTNYLEDLSIIVNLEADQAPVVGDYFTVGTYYLYRNNTQNLSAVDRTKYYFQNEVPEHAAPNTPEGVEYSFDQNSSMMRIIWDDAIDSDTLDNSLAYEINYGIGELVEDGWITKPNSSLNQGEASEINGRNFTKIFLEPNQTYNIGLLAKDDFGNVSEATTTVFSVPDAVLPYGMSDVQWGNIDESGDSRVSFDANGYPFMNSDNKASAIIFFYNQMPPSGYSFSNNDSRWNIGGSNKVLDLEYRICSGGTGNLVGAFLMHNRTDCPTGSGLRKNYTYYGLASGETSFEFAISGILDSGSEAAGNFSATDYITIGFYELSGSTFSQVALYPKKIYFTE